MQKINVKALIEKHSTQEEPKLLDEMTREEFERSGKILEVKTGGGRKVYIASTKEIVERKQKEGEAWFTPEEVENLKGKHPEMVEKVIDAKEIFPGAKTIQ